jgi:hypothetical protein
VTLVPRSGSTAHDGQRVNVSFEVDLSLYPAFLETLIVVVDGEDNKGNLDRS